MSSTEISAIEGFIRKHLRILGEPSPLPRIAIVNHLGAKWHGRHTYFPKAGDYLMEVQRSVLADEPTLERIVAHETVHHAEAHALTDADRQLLRMGRGRHLLSHGSSFTSRASKINSVMGPGFVTITSDQGYKATPSTKEFSLLIMPLERGMLGYQWAARLSPAMRAFIERKQAEGARLTTTRDERFTRGAKIGPGGWSVPRDDETRAKLASLYEGKSS